METLSAATKLKAILATGLTTVAVASKTGITQATISRIASGKHAEPKEKSVRAIDALYSRLCLQRTSPHALADICPAQKEESSHG